MFSHNAELCWRIQSRHVHGVVHLLSSEQHRVPDMVLVLITLVQLDDAYQMLVKRNRVMVMQQMLHKYPMDAPVFELTATERFTLII